MESELLFGQTMKADHRQYDIEVHQASDGDRFLLIRESRQQQSKLVISGTIMVPADHVQDFRRAMRVAFQFLNNSSRHATARANDVKAYDVAEVRESFAQAYAKWTREDDDRLKALFAKRRKIGELAAEFQRRPSAIISRLRKLGLVEES